MFCFFQMRIKHAATRAWKPEVRIYETKYTSLTLIYCTNLYYSSASGVKINRDLTCFSALKILYILIIKMYIIKCQEDGSFCMVKNEDVICDVIENVIEIGDCVPFVWNSKRYTGQVVKCSGK